MLTWLDRLARTSLTPEEDRAWLAAKRLASLVRVVEIGEESSTMMSQFTRVYPGVMRRAFLGVLGFTCWQALLLGVGPATATEVKNFFLDWAGAMRAFCLEGGGGLVLLSGQVGRGERGGR